MSGRLLEGRPWWGGRRIGKTSLDVGLSRYGSLGSQGTAADEQLAMDLGSAPQPVLKTHSSDEIAHLFADLRSAPERTGFPSPVGGKTRSMPTHNSLGPDDRNGVKYARTATIEPNEQGTVGPAQMQSTWRALP